MWAGGDTESQRAGRRRGDNFHRQQPQLKLERIDYDRVESRIISWLLQREIQIAT